MLTRMKPARKFGVYSNPAKIPRNRVLGANPVFRPYWDAIVEGTGEPLSEFQILELVGHDESFVCYPDRLQTSNSPADSDSQASSEDRLTSTEWGFAADSSQQSAASDSSEQDAKSVTHFDKSHGRAKSDLDVDRRFICPFNNTNCRGKRRSGPYAFYATKKYNLERHIKNCHGREWQSRGPEQRRRLLAECEVKQTQP